jgi:hypothetical protein
LGIPVNGGEIETMFQRHAAGQRNHTRSLWTLLSLALWERRHFSGRRHALPLAGADCRKDVVQTVH